MKYYEKSVELGLNDPVPFNASEWIELPERMGLMRHLPTGRMYLVHSHGDPDSLLPFDPYDCDALLVGKGKKLPSRDELVKHGLEAITAFLKSRGLLENARAVSPEGLPDVQQKRHRSHCQECLSAGPRRPIRHRKSNSTYPFRPQLRGCLMDGSVRGS